VPEVPRSSAPPAVWQEGTVIKERYRLGSLLRRGGMGSVWRAEHLELRSPVAIKLLEPEVARDPTMVQRFLREAQAAAALRSPNVVQILDYGVDAGQAFIAMEMLEGEPLSVRIARLGRLPPEEVVRFLTDVLRAMQKAHEAGIIHRDLKPDNLFICKDEPEFAKVLDFGVAKIKKGAFGEGTGLGTQTGMMLGTPYYMSPEQAQAKEIDPRSDLWSVAVIAFEALLGRRPFEAEAFGDLVIAICTAPTPIPSRFGPVPHGFDEWFVRGTQRDPARRFASARDMAEELERVQRTGSTTGVPRSGSLSAPSAASLDLQLTTGQRSAVARMASQAAPERGSNAGLFALLAVGALILVGVAAFAFGGGARALRQAEVSAEQKHGVVVGAAMVVPPGSASVSPVPPAR
jgi:serine/threonine protein kinase